MLWENHQTKQLNKSVFTTPWAAPTPCESSTLAKEDDNEKIHYRDINHSDCFLYLFTREGRGYVAGQKRCKTNDLQHMAKW